MNDYKIRYDLDLIRREGKLPEDPYGQTLSVNDLVEWFGLEKVLNEKELDYVRRELQEMKEAEGVFGRFSVRR